MVQAEGHDRTRGMDLGRIPHLFFVVDFVAITVDMRRCAGMTAIEYVLTFDPNAIADRRPDKLRDGSSLIVEVGRTGKKLIHRARVIPLYFHKRVVSLNISVYVGPRRE